MDRKKKGGGTSLYIHHTIQYRRRGDLAFPEKQYESVFVEVDKTIFNTNRNIIGKIYNPPSSKLKCFNSNLAKLLNAIKKEKEYAFLMGDFNANSLNELKIVLHISMTFQIYFLLIIIINQPTH